MTYSNSLALGRKHAFSNRNQNAVSFRDQSTSDWPNQQHHYFSSLGMLTRAFIPYSSDKNECLWLPD